MADLGAARDPPSEAERLAVALEQSHNERFDCDDFDLAVYEDGNEEVYVCDTCRFVVARVNTGYEGGEE